MKALLRLYEGSIKALCWTEGGEMFAEEEDDDLREAEAQLRQQERELAQARRYCMQKERERGGVRLYI
jgi:hypothetical protein